MNTPPRSKFRRAILLLLPLAIISMTFRTSFAVEGASSQDDVLRAISKGVEEPNNSSGVLLAVLAVVGGLAIILVIVSKREKREAAPKSLVHHGKLLREILKAGLPLKPVEIKQLKLIAEFQPDGGESDPPLSNPLTLLLCPSVLVKRLKTPPPKLDRKVLSQVVKKLGARKLVAAESRG